jgi:hypothetical protein
MRVARASGEPPAEAVTVALRERLARAEAPTGWPKTGSPSGGPALAGGNGLGVPPTSSTTTRARPEGLRRVGADRHS